MPDLVIGKLGLGLIILGSSLLVLFYHSNLRASIVNQELEPLIDTVEDALMSEKEFYIPTEDTEVRKLD